MTLKRPGQCLTGREDPETVARDSLYTWFPGHGLENGGSESDSQDFERAVPPARGCKVGGVEGAG